LGNFNFHWLGSRFSAIFNNFLRSNGAYLFNVKINFFHHWLVFYQVKIAHFFSIFSGPNIKNTTLIPRLLGLKIKSLKMSPKKSVYAFARVTKWGEFTYAYWGLFILARFIVNFKSRQKFWGFFFPTRTFCQKKHYILGDFQQAHLVTLPFC
jgi:hypothetical protein